MDWLKLDNAFDITVTFSHFVVAAFKPPAITSRLVFVNNIFPYFAKHHVTADNFSFILTTKCPAFLSRFEIPSHARHFRCL